MADELPDKLRINAWTGAAPADPAQIAGSWGKWSTKPQLDASGLTHLAAEEPADERDWMNANVGWGLVVADNDGLSEADRAAGKDLPDALRELVEERKGPIFRYRAQGGVEFLRRYYTDRKASDLDLADSKRGTAPGRVPKYLLIWGSPAPGAKIGHVPWRYQYLLNGTSYVGRLDLEGDALENYVTALRDGWKTSPAQSKEPVVWSVDHDDSDITHLMWGVVGNPVAKKLRADAEIGNNVRFFEKGAATRDALRDALADANRPPGLIVTTSHGMTGPLNDPVAMARDLGMLVDQNGALLQPADVLAKWDPDGAIWYSHACCSAGSDDASQYLDVVDDGEVKDVLKGVAGIGATVAPFPKALLGAKKPLRAFIGHVEPTFDWTIRHPQTGQALTTSLQESLYDGMYRAKPEPVGMSFRRFFANVGSLFSRYMQTVEKTAKALDPAERQKLRATALRLQLTALDRQACVILGDPTVALTPLANG